ncbi:hypothetical protein ACOMHN_003206 [Nucella lapillus]
MSTTSHNGPGCPQRHTMALDVHNVTQWPWMSTASDNGPGCPQRHTMALDVHNVRQWPWMSTMSDNGPECPQRQTVALDVHNVTPCSVIYEGIPRQSAKSGVDDRLCSVLLLCSQ